MCLPKLFSFPLALAATHPPPSDDGKGLSFAMQDVIPMVPSKPEEQQRFVTTFIVHGTYQVKKPIRPSKPEMPFLR
jgi:hypothetical protein